MDNKLSTKRLQIRPIMYNDVMAIHEYASKKDITMMMHLPKETLDATKQFVKYAVNEWNKKEPYDREFVIIFNEKIIGGINLECSDEDGTYEIGWVIHTDFRDNGFAAEAGKAMLTYAFNFLQANKIISHCDSRNTASKMVMEKLNMKLVSDSGTRLYPKTGITSGEYLYSILKEEYRNEA